MIEGNVSKAILQETKQVEFSGVIISVAPPSLATLIKVSELIAHLPKIEANTESILIESLRIAKHTKVIGEIAAYLLLGAKGVQTIRKTAFFGLIRYKKRITVRKLTELLLNESPKRLKDLIIEQLQTMGVEHFFAITTSLAEANLLRPTREVG